MKELLKNKRAWSRGLQVKIAELLDGENFEVAILGDGIDWTIVSKNEYLIDDRMLGLLNILAEDHGAASLHMIAVGAAHCTFNDYGFDSECVLTDIEFEKTGFVNDDLLITYAELFNFMLPPVFMRGGFSGCLPRQFAHGPTRVAPGSTINTHFKERLGIVVTPLEEQHSPILDGRLIGKVMNPIFEKVIDVQTDSSSQDT